MSFAFAVMAPNAEAAAMAIQIELAKVCAAQPVHAHDAELVQAIADSYLGLVDLMPDHVLQVSVNGSVATIDGKVTGCGVGIGISQLVPTLPAE